MNKLLSASLLTLMVLIAASCKQDSQTPTGPQSVLPLSSGGNTAHPALTYPQGAVMVADSDLSHQTSIYKISSGAVIGNCWSPTGGSIAFLHYNAGLDSIDAIDVSVNSKGVPVGSNFRHVYTLPSGTYARRGMAWSSTSTMGMIAFGEVGATTGLYVISQSGGTPTLVSSSASYPSWSPDDSYLAAVSNNEIVIFNTSTWATVATINANPGPSLEWSRSGLNKLAFWSGGQLYFCDPTDGATPSPVGVYGNQALTWSPNNSSVLFFTGTDPYPVWKNQAFTTDTTKIGSLSPLGGAIKWKR